jgi:hypothetical protein
MIFPPKRGVKMVLLTVMPTDICQDLSLAKDN